MKNLLLLIFAIIPVFLLAETQVPPGPVSGTWDLAGSPYMVNGEIYISESETLTIEPGVEVRFTGWYKFIVNGSLLAEGTDAQQILFTADDTNNRWHGIRFMNATGTSVLDHCIVEYGQTMLGGTGTDPDYLGGGVLCYASAAASITIKNSIIRNNIADIGGGIEILGSYPLIENCEITGNSAQWGGGIDAMLMSSGKAIIKNCTIAYNVNSGNPNSGGGISAGINSNLEIKGNVIKHNTANSGAGLRTYQPYELLVTGNTIAYNHAWANGGGIGLWNATAIGTFQDNTIVYNHATDGGGVFVAMNCSPSFESDILYFNTSGSGGPNQVHLNGTGGAPFFNYCDVQGGCEGFSGIGAPSFPCETNYLECIDADPLFADPDNDDFNLTWENYPIDDETMSGCIDKGCPGMFPAPDGTCNDIGAFDYFQVLWPPDTLIADDISDIGFLAIWSYTNPATGYKLDVARDAAFDTCVLLNQVVEGDTSYYVGNLDPDTKYYFRVRAFNSSQTSEYSDTADMTTLDTGISTFEPEGVNVYASTDKVYINIETANTRGLVWVYDLTGILLTHQGLISGNNVIDPGVSNQVVIVRVTIDGRMYHRKLFVH